MGVAWRYGHTPVRGLFVTVIVFAFLLGSAPFATPVDVQAVNAAGWEPSPPKKGVSLFLIKLQILLARANFSPGEINAKPGEHLDRAIAAFAAAQGMETGKLTQELWDRLGSMSSDPVLTDYTISDDDVRGPFAQRIPKKMEEMKNLPALAYTSPQEKLSEKSHISPDLLAALNPGKKFDRAGEKIIVANLSTTSLPQKVARIEVDKTRQELRAFDRNGKLVAYYPATVGSEEKPAPSGTLKVTGVKKDPTYHYNPIYAFKGVRTKKPFTIQPGPNNPVGLVWIGLSGQGYGIHGTPEPANVGKTQSHGCVRLTNWDALQLAAAVAKGIPVDFVGEQKQAAVSKERRGRRAHR
jgi:lipoprotein-anchoring transpeptidase ErfK/SrfK